MFKPTRRNFLLGLSAACLAGCAEEDPGLSSVPIQNLGPSMDISGLGGSSGESRRSAKYPAGPYGSNNPELGEVVPDIRLQGYIDAPAGRLITHGDFRMVDLSEFRKDQARFLLIHVSALWCAPCLTAASELTELKDAIEAADARAIELVLDGQGVGADPSNEQLEKWTKTASLEVPTFRAGDELTRKTFPEREYAYILDLDTMQVVWRESGFYNNVTVVELALDALEREKERYDSL